MSTKLLDKLNQIEELAPVLEAIYKEFEIERDSWKEEPHSETYYDKYDNRCYNCRVTDDELEEKANEKLAADDSGCFESVIINSSATAEIVEFFRKVVKEHYVC